MSNPRSHAVWFLRDFVTMCCVYLDGQRMELLSKDSKDGSCLKSRWQSSGNHVFCALSMQKAEVEGC